MKVLEYDHMKALGDTVLEKFESLYTIIARQHKKNPIRFMIGSLETTSMLEAATVGFDPFPLLMSVGDLQIVGKYRCWQLFKSTQVAKDELVLFGEKENAVIKFKNFVSL